MNLEKAVFTMDDILIIEGVYDPAVNWNGFVCPYFTREAVAGFLDDLMLKGHIAGYTIASNMVFVQQNDVAAEDADEYDFEVIDGSELCMLGGYSWIWTVVGM